MSDPKIPGPAAPDPVAGFAAEGGDGASLLLHATCITVPSPGGASPDAAPPGALLTGRAGAGKSSLALDILSRGGVLVSDDLVRVDRRGEALIASCPRPALAGMIEARGIGILRAPHAPAARLTLLVDLDAVEQDRLPPPRQARLLGLALPRILGGDPGVGAASARGAAILLLLRGGGAPLAT